jgi:hypothetical protein
MVEGAKMGAEGRSEKVRRFRAPMTAVDWRTFLDLHRKISPPRSTLNGLEIGEGGMWRKGSIAAPLPARVTELGV